MADHRAEQVMDAFTSLVMGLATTGANVVRDRVYDVPNDVDAALSIYIGSDEPIEESPWPYIDSLLTIYADINVRINSDVVVSQWLNLIRKEMVVAIMVDVTIGLSFVHEIEESIANAPDMSHGEQPVAVQRTEWTVKYRRSITDPSA